MNSERQGTRGGKTAGKAALFHLRRPGHSRILEPLKVLHITNLEHRGSGTSTPKGRGEALTTELLLAIPAVLAPRAPALPLGPAPHRSPSVVISCGSAGKGRRWRRWGNLCGWKGVSAAETGTEEGGEGGGVPCRNRGGGAAQAPRPGARLCPALAPVTVDVAAPGLRVGACSLLTNTRSPPLFT